MRQRAAPVIEFSELISNQIYYTSANDYVDALMPRSLSAFRNAMA